jgi:hypothetical protein
MKRAVIALALVLQGCDAPPPPEAERNIIEKCLAPRPDITAYEWLAVKRASMPDDTVDCDDLDYLLEDDVDPRMWFYEDDWNSLPPATQRHFAEPPPMPANCPPAQGERVTDTHEALTTLVPGMGITLPPQSAPVKEASNVKDGTTAETVVVKYRGPVNLAPFKCNTITRSSFIERVCYDADTTYMLIDLNGVWYHYCEIDRGTVEELLAAPSMGHYYNAAIKGRFDCRTHRVPAY